MHLIGYFKNHIAAVAIVLVLLAVQAFADLALPNLTSQIVDVGIQQSGVESVATDALTERTYNIAYATADSEGKQLLAESYDAPKDKDKAASQDTYVINAYGQEHKQQLEELLTPALIVAHSAKNIDSINTMMAKYDSGEVDREELLQKLSECEPDAFTASDEASEPAIPGQSSEQDMREQQAISAARQEYEDAGYNLTDMQMGFLVRVGAMMLGLAALGMAMSILIGFVASRTGAKIGYDLRNKLFTRVVSFSEAEIGKFSAASLITRGTNDIQLIQNISVMLLRMVLSAPILAIGGIIMVMVTNASMGWIIVVAIVAVFCVIGIVFKVAMPKFRIMQKLIDKVNLVAREMLNGMPVIRAFNRQAYEEERFDVASTKLMRTQLFTNRVMTFMMPVMNLIMNATSVAIVWIGASYIDMGTIQTGDMIAFITYAMVIIMSFLMLGMVSIMLPRADVAAERVNEVIACKPAIEDPDEDVAKGAVQKLQQEATSERGFKIEFEDVSFKYADSDECVLENISFTVDPGQTLAIVGSTGSGKSTVIKLIERFYDVTKGSIKVDGVDIRDLPQHVLRSQFGYVPQKAFLFSGTIYTNVAYSDESMSEDVVEEALECAQALDFVNDKPDGADTEISQGGTNVSGGQRQRLAIARAFATKARAYLFDDSFSALDYKTDASLRQAIKESLGGVTQVIVAQRISTVMDADQILVLDEGRVVGCGTHEDLMSNCSEYREIALSQLSPEELGEVSVA